MSIEQLVVAGTAVEVHRKKIKNLHVGVYPPDGRVRVAAPESVSVDAIRLAVLTRMDWIRRKQLNFAAQERQSERRYISGETHYVFGRPLRLNVVEWDKKIHRVSMAGSERLCLFVTAGSDQNDRALWLRNWRRTQLREVAGRKVEKWSRVLQVSPSRWGIREMKTKWGSCNPQSRTIWLNLELSKKPVETIDYIALHEMAHLISHRHDARFIGLLDEHMPNWRRIRAELNMLPLSAWRE